MPRLATHLLLAITALAAGALGASALDRPRPQASARTVRLPPGPEQVRTVVVTRTIHRTIHAHAPVPTPAPRPVVAPTRLAVATPAQPVAQAAPLRTRTSGSLHRAAESGDEGGDD